MPEVIYELAGRLHWEIEYIKSFPTETIIEIWREDWKNGKRHLSKKNREAEHKKALDLWGKNG